MLPGPFPRLIMLVYADHLSHWGSPRRLRPSGVPRAKCLAILPVICPLFQVLQSPLIVSSCLLGQGQVVVLEQGHRRC